MTKNLEGKKCPKFSAECTSGLNLSNKDFEGKNFVIYFYPKDSPRRSEPCGPQPQSGPAEHRNNVSQEIVKKK